MKLFFSFFILISSILIISSCQKNEIQIDNPPIFTLDNNRDTIPKVTHTTIGEVKNDEMKLEFKDYQFEPNALDCELQMKAVKAHYQKEADRLCTNYTIQVSCNDEFLLEKKQTLFIQPDFRICLLKNIHPTLEDTLIFKLEKNISSN